MPKRKNGPPKRVLKVYPAEIEWVDATGHSGWQSVDEALDRKPVIMYTLGYVLEKNNRFLKLVRSVEDKGDDVGDVFTIPSDWVRKIKRLKKK